MPEKHQPLLAQPERNLAERVRRIAVLRQWLDQTTDETLRLPLIDELASLLADMGKTDEALDIRRNKQLPVFQKLGDVRSEAITHGKITDILHDCGQLSEAAELLHKIFPVFQSIGDESALNTIRSRIADIEKTSDTD